MYLLVFSRSFWFMLVKKCTPFCSIVQLMSVLLLKCKSICIYTIFHIALSRFILCPDCVFVSFKYLGSTSELSFWPLLQFHVLKVLLLLPLCSSYVSIKTTSVIQLLWSSLSNWSDIYHCFVLLLFFSKITIRVSSCHYIT